MQPHWVEPQPLGEAQRTGMFQIAPAQQPMHPDPRIYAQIRSEQARLQGRHAAPGGWSGLGTLSSGTVVGAGLGLIFAGGFGYWLGRKHGSARTERRVKEAVGAKQLEGVLKNDGHDDEYEEYEEIVEDAEDADDEEDED